MEDAVVADLLAAGPGCEGPAVVLREGVEIPGRRRGAAERLVPAERAFALVETGEFHGLSELRLASAENEDPALVYGEDVEIPGSERERAARPLRSVRRWWIGGALVVVALGYTALADLQLTLNGSESLPEAAYLQWHWPKALWRGAVVAVPPPALFGAAFEGYSIVKRVGGLPGDPIRNFGDRVCLAGTCYPAELRDGHPFADLLPSGVVPPGMVALFGEASNSLDSRYARFGLVPISDIEAVGIPLPGFPRWQRIAAWMGLND